MNRLGLLLVLLAISPLSAAAISPHAKWAPVGLSEARWTGGLMGERFDTCRDVMVPNMRDIMWGTQYSQFL